MQKAKGKILLYLTLIPVAVCCFLRYYQLTRLTDFDTGLLSGGDYRTVIIYALLAVVIAFYLFFSLKNRAEKNIDFETLRGGRILCALLSAAFFADFIHQCSNCFYAVSDAEYIDRVYIIQLAAAGLLSLLCCFYFAACLLTAGGSGYDFRNFNVLHLAPAIWGLVRLLIIMLDILDVRLSVESVLEFLLLCFLIMFFFGFALTVDNGGAVPRMLGFFARSSAALGTVIALPRLAAMIALGSEIAAVDFTCVTYFAAGLFALYIAE